MAAPRERSAGDGRVIHCDFGRVAVATLDRPPANALNRAFFDELLYHGRTYAPGDALARRLVDEVVPAAELMSRAVAAAEELATRPPTAFAATKTSLRADALRHLHAVVATGDPTWDVWRTAE